MIAIDLFAGGGGSTLGATLAGVKVAWAGNHNPKAVEVHQANHPSVLHSCQDLHQADWGEVPAHDLLYGSPCCQGHSKARGKKDRSKKADKSRNTAWAIVDCLDTHRPYGAIIENVKEIRDWDLFTPWLWALESLGYSVSQHLLNTADFGIPQTRERLYIIATRSKNPIDLNLRTQPRVPARTFIDFSDNHHWEQVSTRCLKTQNRIKNGRRKFGEIFLEAAYSGEAGGRSLDKPVGTITTVNKHYLVKGDRIRPLTILEQATAQSFPESYIWHKGKVVTKGLIGNAVAPQMLKQLTTAYLSAV